MKKSFWRIHIQNKNTKYNYICGGTIEEVFERVQDEDARRNDGFKVAQAILAYMVKVNKPMKPEVFYEDSATNGLHFRLFSCGEIEVEQED